MNIIALISRNLRRRPQTLRFPDRPVPARGFRGLVAIDTGACLACGICDYVCVSGAITMLARDLGSDWTYDPGRCTFCGRCVDHCPGAALSHDADRAANYERPGALAHAATVVYPACPECGRPARPFSERLLAQGHEQISEELRERSRLCERCRRRRAQTVLKKGFGGAEGEERSDDGR